MARAILGEVLGDRVRQGHGRRGEEGWWGRKGCSELTNTAWNPCKGVVVVFPDKFKFVKKFHIWYKIEAYDM